MQSTHLKKAAHGRSDILGPSSKGNWVAAFGLILQLDLPSELLVTTPLTYFVRQHLLDVLSKTHQYAQRGSRLPPKVDERVVIVEAMVLPVRGLL